jgi:hypothetical protein
MPSLRAFARLVAVAVILLSSPAFAASRICMSADTLMFGQQPVGSSTMATMSVANCGDAPFAFTDVSRHSATNPAFRTQTTCSTGMTLRPGDTCAATVWFEPTTPGQASGALWFHNTTSTPDQLVTFYGRAVDGQAGTASLAFSPPLADFGGEPVGDETSGLVVTLRNAGSAPLVPSALVLNGLDPYDFRGEADTGAGACGVGRAIAPGGSCTLLLYFHPQASGLRQATLVVDAPQLATLAFFTLAGQGIAASATVPVIEYHNATDGQYFLTADAAEQALLDGGGLGPDWSRTGASFNAYAMDATNPQALAVCRFFGTPGFGPNSHFYTAYANECAAVREDPHWIEEGATFRALLPVDGNCAGGDVVVLRLWKPGATVTQTRHRYVVDPALVAPMQSDGWVLEGPVFCAPR